MLFVIKSSILNQLHHAQHKLKLTTKEESLDPLIILLSEFFKILFFLDPFLENDSISEKTIIGTHLHQNHGHDLRPHLEDLLLLYNQFL